MVKNTFQRPSNFDFLRDEMLVETAKAAEKIYHSSPPLMIAGLRMFAEGIARAIAVKWNIDYKDSNNNALPLKDIVGKILTHIDYPDRNNVRMLFNELRKLGNNAAHELVGSERDARESLEIARELAIFYHRTVDNNPDFKPKKFIRPPDIEAELEQWRREHEELKLQLATETNDEKRKITEQALQAAEEKIAELKQEQDKIESYIVEVMSDNEKLERENKLLKAAEEKWLAERDALDEEIKQSILINTPARIRSASQRIELSERLTRIVIDEQLRDAGWEADSETLTYKNGARPEKGKNKAIAEWQIGKMRADYVLFAGLTPLAVVEAKKKNSHVAEKIRQAERYAREIKITPPMLSAWELSGLSVPWHDAPHGHYKVPFVYSCNGKPLLSQIAEKSGTWFRDVRKSYHLKRPLTTFHRPAHLLELLQQDHEKAAAALKDEPFGYLKLRDYQQKAIEAIEDALAKHARQILVAMATGTGKTRTITGLMYRLLKQKRFQRILFLVDRSALGKQAFDTFQEAPLERNFPLAKHYNIAELGDLEHDMVTKIQVSTVQAMVRRIFNSDNPPAIDQFDCIIIDEAHRGYTLDQEMTAGEMTTREASPYLSTYRRVIDYFDAVKIALTATPAKHTSDIFGKPIFTYSYREAVAADWLVDHEPPITFTTKLSAHGITFPKGDIVEFINPTTGETDIAELEDELHFEVEKFNKTVVTESFNRVICNELAQHDLDIFGEEKTLIFCANDLHADMVKRLLDEAFSAEYGEEYNQAAVAKITGQSDQVEKLIRQYKNERYPNVAITVDLLTTGIDVPKICNLVFLRRVKSRILFEQMLGRATRRCDAIGKTVFRIFDPVDIYAALENVNTMLPLVKNVQIPTEQLIAELSDSFIVEKMQAVEGDREDCSQADSVLEHLQQKVIRVLRPALSQAEHKPELKEKLAELEQHWGVKSVDLARHLQQLGVTNIGDFLKKHDLAGQLAEVQALLAHPRPQYISEHEDELISRQQSYGQYDKPEDYLESFNAYMKQHLNEHLSFLVAVNRPRDLTRQDLKNIRDILYPQGYSDKHLDAAEAVAAGIIAHIRRAALGERLIPYEQRVDLAVQKILQKHPQLSTKQRKWIERLAKMLKQETIIDRESLSQDHRIADEGGIKRIDKLLNHQLDEILAEFQAFIWSEEQYMEG